MIPKIIHYCWFGRGPKPASAERYIAGWKRLMPDYQFMEWNEDNFDIHCCPYVEQAYQVRKFAFVSDYARGHALYTHGGIYLDTDVEVLKPFDDLLDHRSFWGFEAANYIATSTIGCVPQHEIIKEYLDQYHIRTFTRPDDSLDMTTNVAVVTKLWQNRGLLLNDEQQTIDDDNLFLPQAYFSPYDYTIGIIAPLTESYAIHHYAKTWIGPWAQFKGYAKKQAARLCGGGGIRLLQRVLRRNRAP